MTRHRFTSIERADIWHADSIPLTGDRYAVCRYCGRIIHQGEPWHVAHEEPHSSRLWLVLPHSWRDSKMNVGVACPVCNMRAGATPMTTWQSISFRWKLKIIAASLIITGIIVWILYLTLTNILSL